MTLEKGSLLNNRYRIVEILGQGGMGSVYHAQDENLSVDVAVKENLFTSDEYSRQFRLEAVILANVRNQHLPRVTDYFIVDDLGQYLVMDYVAGEDLRQRMERLGNISQEDAILIGAAVCEAISYLHSCNTPVVHRDIKPGNIKIAPDGEVYLVDFGLAKLFQVSQATTTGARAMTPGFSPPEQYGSARTDPRSDIYSLGATLYAALTGVVPEDGLARLMDNIKLTPIRQINPRVSLRLAAAIEKAMEAYPDDRFQNAKEFRQGLLFSSSKTLHFIDLDLNILVQPPPQNPALSAQSGALLGYIPSNIEQNKDLEIPFSMGTPQELGPTRTGSSIRRFQQNSILEIISMGYARSKPRFQLYASIGVLLAVILLTISGWFIWNSIPAFNNNLSTTQALDLTKSALISVEPSSSAPTNTPAQTQDIASLPPTSALIIQATSTSDVPPLPITPIPTPQGGGKGEIGFVSNRTGIPQVYVMGVNSNDPRQITNEQDGACQPDWSPDGEKIVFISPCRKKQETYQGSSLFILDITTHIRTALPVSLGGDFEPAWSPDGKHIAFTSFRDGYMEIYKINLENKQFTRLTKSQSIVGGIYARQPAWNPFGSQIVYTLKRQGVRQIWVTTDGDANISKPNVQLVQSGNSFLDSMPAWSPDGQYIVFNQTNFRGTAPYSLLSIRYENRASKQAVPVNIEPLPVANVGFSSDGQWIVFESWLGNAGTGNSDNQDIYMTTILGMDRKRLTTDPDIDFDPVWRPGIRK